MPIANCYIQIEVSKSQLEILTKEWAEVIEVDLKDICLSFVKVDLQTGHNYKVMVSTSSLTDNKKALHVSVGVAKLFLSMNDA